MSSFNPPGNADQGDGLNSLLAQLRQQQSNQAQGHQDSPPQDLLARFNSYNHGHPYPAPPPAADSPLMDSSFSGDYAALPPAPTPPVGFQSSQFPPGMMSTFGGPRNPPPQNTERTANLLNLLKFSGSGSQAPPPSVPSAPSHPPPISHDTPLNFSTGVSSSRIVAPAPAPADPQGLLAALMRGAVQAEQQGHDSPPPPAPAPPPHKRSPSPEAQTFLLNLLNRGKPSQNDSPAFLSEPTKTTILTPQSIADSATDVSKDQYRDSRSLGGSSYAPPMSSNSGNYDFEPKVGKYDFGMAESAGKNQNAPYNYGSGFPDDKSTTSSTKHPLSASPGATPSPSALQIRMKPQAAAHNSPSSTHTAPDQGRTRSGPDTPQQKTQDPLQQPHEAGGHDGTPDASAGLEKPTETVHEAVTDLAAKADQEAQEALARAEEEQTQVEIARGLKSMMNARSDSEFQQSPHAAAQAIQKELDRDKNDRVLEDTLPADVAKTVREIVDETARDPVAENWESADADADEIVVAEEETPAPVKVYNFPMRPWIAINVQEGANEPRPLFADGSLLDIAKLKKEFDQIDRNLVAASENYVLYGMSKAGGFRVIRQTDGRDVRLFADTKDRIFNVGILSTPSDALVQQEAAIATGVSGTVYWVQVRDGSKDLLEDAHPEQYGFALPPMTTLEGDAPGGVLKTRARMSSLHPEYFAVGRGKSINIIWPALILQHQLFKPGHERVVDADRLMRQCSLKINTGKAGKDFCFSQDDTMVVSLDKSGRVKFWDVRDLTAADGRNARLPAHTSLEVKDPVLTLTTTPEGERAWPTSVMLLDKLRPYQKRCALRYMVVGMKQNHTLQLWDLALGKPVQEFNLPHSKESDAVCSVMYHPTTGMIVVGHPTRNSIYFLHLSAPKYSLKNLSQVDYIEKLVAGDAMIPQPESTAVISGVREYSFSNRGILRSLDILVTPSGMPDDSDPALFELYAVHSKGVTCIFVRQAELGWTKDNKVIAPVDALESGMVVLAKLKPIPAPAPEPVQTEATDNAAAQPSNQQAQRAGSRPAAAAAAMASAGNQNSSGSAFSGHPGSEDSSRRGPDSAAPAKPAKEGEPSAHPNAGPVPPGHGNASLQNNAPAPTPPAGNEKSERKSRKKKAQQAAAAAENSNGGGSPRVTPAVLKSANQEANKAADSEAAKTLASHQASVPTTGISQEAIDLSIAKMEATLRSAVSEVFDASLRGHQKKIDDTARARNKAFEEAQARVIDTISETLSRNTEAVIDKIVSRQLSEQVVPHLAELIHENLNASIGPASLSPKINHAVSVAVQGSMPLVVANSMQKELQRVVPSAVNQTLLKPEFIKTTADKVAQSISGPLTQQVLGMVKNEITPMLTTLVVQTGQRINNDTFRHLQEQIEDLERQRHADSSKIDQLVNMVTRLADRIASQAPGPLPAGLQPGPSSRDRQPSHTSHHPPMPSSLPPHHSPSEASTNQLTRAAPSTADTVDADLEMIIEDISKSVQAGDYETASIKWLQSQRDGELFAKYWSQINPTFLASMPDLVLLSVGATVSQTWEDYVRERCAYLEIILYTFSSHLPTLEPQVEDATPKLMGIFIQRIEKLFMTISSVRADEPLLGNLSRMVQLANRIAESCKQSIAARMEAGVQAGSRNHRY